MKMIQIVELRELIDLQFPHICVSHDDLNQFLWIPKEKNRFYPMNKYRRSFYEKAGFFHNGKTTVWAVNDWVWMKDEYKIPPNHIRIADKETPTVPGGADWSANFSFEEAGSAKKILRMMKLKAFW